jgi:hypothetical protein
MPVSRDKSAETILGWVLPRLIGGGVLAYSILRGFLPHRPRELLTCGTPRALRRWMLGKSRNRLASALGMPRGVAGNDFFADANIWYYALPRAKTPAIAVMFQDGVVRNVKFLSDPVWAEDSRSRR